MNTFFFCGDQLCKKKKDYVFKVTRNGDNLI